MAMPYLRGRYFRISENLFVFFKNLFKNHLARKAQVCVETVSGRGDHVCLYHGPYGLGEATIGNEVFKGMYRYNFNVSSLRGVSQKHFLII